MSDGTAATAVHGHSMQAGRAAHTTNADNTTNRLTSMDNGQRLGTSDGSSAATANNDRLGVDTAAANNADRMPSLDQVRSPISPGLEKKPHPLQSRSNSFDLDDYFTGPRDISRHSKWPAFLRMHGSILPKMILPLLFVLAWSTTITCISRLVHTLEIDSVLLTILGFVVGLGLSFRSSTAYERYAEGRRYWQMLIQSSHGLGRVFWVHGIEKAGGDPRESLLKKISAMNLVVAFAVSLKHHLRFEPYSAYPDLQHLVGHLNTFAQQATSADPAASQPRKKNSFKETGEYLGVSFAASNPRKTLKKTPVPLGHLPIEILNHLCLTVDQMCLNGQLPVPMQQTMAYNNIAVLNDVLGGCERILNTPLPIAYTIAISQITWVYVLVLPFQLLRPLEWITIPASAVAAYIILGLLMIGSEIENPFGTDVNDLPLEIYCEQIAHDLDVIASLDVAAGDSFLMRGSNTPLYPVSAAPVDMWMKRSETKLREAIMTKPKTTFKWRQWKGDGKSIMVEKKGDDIV
jgi:putative membrane protein